MKSKYQTKSIFLVGFTSLLLLGCSLLGDLAPTPIPPTSASIPSTPTLISITIPPASPTTINNQVEQARIFADPILQAIANHQPDFVDDFSTADKGWNGGNLQPGESAVIQNGVARLTVNDKDVSFGNEALNRKDFVLKLEARVAEGDKATQLIVNFHSLSSEYWFYVVVNSAGNTWLVDKNVPANQRNLANGIGNVSPFSETTQIMIVARGSRAAIYLNKTPVAYFEDTDFDTSGGTGLFCQSLRQAVCEFDNVEFWDLAKVLGLP